MYNFVDTNETLEVLVLPSEALKINGEYIENLVPGYRTLHVSGREALTPELTSYETGIRDGSVLQNSRYPARTITVTYQLVAESNEAFRQAYNTLASVLDVKNAELVFHDEDDKYFTGTPMTVSEVDPGKNAVIGEIEFFCADPFKYSIYEYEAENSLDESSILIDYGGTYKAFPILEADFYSESDVSEDGESEQALTGSGDCGYVAFFTEDEKIIQLGDPDEADKEKAYAKSQTLICQTFKSTTSWGTAAKALWALNKGVVYPPSVQQSGSLAMKVASYAVPADPAKTSATIYTGRSDAGAPSFNYKVVAKTSGRTATTVKVSVSITASLGRDSNYFGHGYGLTASVYIGGSWRNVKLKDKSAYWRGKTGHTVNLSVTLSGLSASTASISGIKFRVQRSDSTGGTAGILPEKSCKSLPVSKYVADVPATYYLAPSSYGSASGKWHGVTMTRTLKADASGDVGAKYFVLTYKQKMCIGSARNATGQRGAFQCQISDASGKIIAGVRIQKGASGRSATMAFYINGASVYSRSVDMSYNNKIFGSKENAVRTSTIKKSGAKVSFNIGGISKTFTNDDIAEMKATKVTFSFEQYSTSAALAYNGIYWAKFVKNNCEMYKDVPNKFSADDVLEADCKNGEIRLNGVPAPSLGALGNDWEGFVLTPGLNQIGTAYSEWVPDGYQPTFKVRYREVFL